MLHLVRCNFCHYLRTVERPPESISEHRDRKHPEAKRTEKGTWDTWTTYHGEGL